MVSGKYATGWGNVAILWGVWNGQNFLMLHLAFCIAYGLPFFGRKAKQGRVLAIIAEAPDELPLSTKAWHKEYAAKLRKQGYSGGIDIVDMPLHLVDMQEAVEDLLKDARLLHAPYDLVIVDTWAANTTGIDQNSNKEVSGILLWMAELAKEYACHIAITHHDNKKGGYTGAGSFMNAVFTMVELEADPRVKGLITVKCKKMRAARAFDDFNILRKDIDLGDGLSSCCIVGSDEPTREDRERQKGQSEFNRDAAFLMELLQTHGPMNQSTFRTLAGEH